MATIRVKGIHRTGTNYMEQLKHRHFVLGPNIKEVRDHYWKHDPVPEFENLDEELKERANNKLIVMIKNPYTWYNSIMRWVDGVNPKAGRPLEACFGTGSIEDVYKRYNFLYSSYKDTLLSNYDKTPYTDGILVRYEDLLVDPESELNKISDKFDLKWKKTFHNITSVPQAASFNANRKARTRYYLAQRPDYSKDLVDRVNRIVDWELMEFYNYYPLED